MGMFGDTFDRTGGVEFPFPAPVVFRALESAVDYLRMKVIESSPMARHLSLKTGASALSWGERVSVSVLEIGPTRSRVEISSAAKTMVGSATSHGKNRKNVEHIITVTGDVLEDYGTAWTEEMGLSHVETPVALAATAPLSIADELQKLSDLRQSGAISDDEYALLKAKLISQ